MCSILQYADSPINMLNLLSYSILISFGKTLSYLIHFMTYLRTINIYHLNQFIDTINVNVEYTTLNHEKAQKLNILLINDVPKAAILDSTLLNHGHNY